ncbi:DnaJ domain-containing protein [Thermodesulfobacteriota bacterium]
MEHTDYYKVLGVDLNAGPKQIKEAYRELAFQYHPDRNKENPETAEQMKWINEAYAVLSNPDKRREYDAMRQQFGSSAYNHFRNSYTQKDIFRDSDIHTVFEEMAKSFGFRNFDDIFREFYGPTYRTFEFKKPGFSARGFFYFSGFGGSRPRVPQIPLPGTLGRLSRYVFEKISGAELPENGADIHDIIDLHPSLAHQGGPYAYHLRRKAKKLVVNIPPGVKDGQKIRLAGAGEDGKGGARSGDLYLQVRIKRTLMQKIKGFVEDLRK